MVPILRDLQEDGQVYAANLLFQEVRIWFWSRTDFRPLSKLSYSWAPWIEYHG